MVNADQIVRMNVRVNENVEAVIDLARSTGTPSVGTVIQGPAHAYCVRLVLRRAHEENGARVVGVLID